MKKNLVLCFICLALLVISGINFSNNKVFAESQPYAVLEKQIDDSYIQLSIDDKPYTYFHQGASYVVNTHYIAYNEYKIEVAEELVYEEILDLGTTIIYSIHTDYNKPATEIISIRIAVSNYSIGALRFANIGLTDTIIELGDAYNLPKAIIAGANRDLYDYEVRCVEGQAGYVLNNEMFKPSKVGEYKLQYVMYKKADLVEVKDQTVEAKITVEDTTAPAINIEWKTTILNDIDVNSNISLSYKKGTKILLPIPVVSDSAGINVNKSELVITTTIPTYYSIRYYDMIEQYALGKNGTMYFCLNKDAVYTFTYKIYDNNDNSSVLKYIIESGDLIAPTLQVNPDILCLNKNILQIDLNGNHIIVNDDVSKLSKLDTKIKVLFNGMEVVESNFENGIYTYELETFGSYEVNFKISDEAGNNASTTMFFTFADYTAPTLIVSDNIISNTYRTNQEIIIDLFENNLITIEDDFDKTISKEDIVIQVKLDNQIISPSSFNNSCYIYIIENAGNYVMYFYLTDNSSNTQMLTKNFEVVVDNTAPIITINNFLEKTYKKETLFEMNMLELAENITISDNFDALSINNVSIELYYDNTIINPVSSDKEKITYQLSKAGSYVIKIIATDMSGNFSSQLIEFEAVEDFNIVLILIIAMSTIVALSIIAFIIIKKRKNNKS